MLGPALSQAWPHFVFFYFTGGGFWGYFGVALVALVYGATRLSYVVNCALFLIMLLLSGCLLCPVPSTRLFWRSLPS